MALTDWLAYDTIRVVKIKSKKLGLLHYAICFVIIVYIAVWVIWVNRGPLEPRGVVWGLQPLRYLDLPPPPFPPFCPPLHLTCLARRALAVVHHS